MEANRVALSYLSLLWRDVCVIDCTIMVQYHSSLIVAP